MTDDEERVGDRTRTGDNQIHSLESTAHKGQSDNDLQSEVQTACGSACRSASESTKVDPDLSRVISAWPTLSKAIKAAILALVREEAS